MFIEFVSVNLAGCTNITLLYAGIEPSFVEFAFLFLIATSSSISDEFGSCPLSPLLLIIGKKKVGIEVRLTSVEPYLLQSRHSPFFLNSCREGDIVVGFYGR